MTFHYSLQAAHRTYSSPAKGTSESHKDPKDKPIRFSTSKARHLTLNETLGDMNQENTSNKPMYIGFIAMAILTYIIFFLPPSKDEEEEWELEDAEISKQQNIKRQ